jgi:hypothetical protein
MTSISRRARSSHCGAVQEDYLLHSQPGDVFFCIAEEEPGSIEFTPVEGRIRERGLRVRSVSRGPTSGRILKERAVVINVMTEPLENHALFKVLRYH